jgi:transposase
MTRRHIRLPVGIEDMEDVVSTNREIEASEPARPTAAAALPRTDAVPNVDERMLTTPSAHGRDIEAGPGQQIAREMARQWLVRAEINAAARPGTTTAEQAEINQLKAEIKRLRDDNETLKAAMILFAGNSTPATTDHGASRRHSTKR